MLQISAAHPGMPRNLMPTRMEEAPKVALDIQCLWRGGRAALTSTTNKFLHREVMAAHRLLRLEQAKQIRQTISLPLKQTQALEKACFLINYNLKQEPSKSSSLRTRCHKVLRATTCPQVPRVDGSTHFYMECDIMLAVYVRMLQAQWQESL